MAGVPDVPQPSDASMVLKMSRRARLSPPCAYLAPRGTWPDGPFRADAPPDVDYVCAAAAAVETELARRGWSATHLARRAGIGPSTVSRLLAGQSWPDFVTMLALEHALEMTLWPRTAPKPPPRRAD